MPENPEEIITGTIDDYLLALADGIVQAQSELNRIAVQTSPGQPAVQYQLPKLDFELKMSFALETETEQTTSTSRRTVPSLSRSGTLSHKLPKLRAMPVNPETTSENFSADAVSTIKGSFIALPVNGGKPPNLLILALLKRTKESADIQIRLRNAAGEPLTGQIIALGIDREFSKLLNEERGLPAQKRALKPSTDFEKGEVVTDANGEAVASLNISNQEDRAVSIVAEATIADISESIIIHQS